MRLPSSFLFLTLLTACASDRGVEDRPLVEDKYRLSADREAFDKMREQVPDEKRLENDEIAFVLQWMGEVKRPPAQIREKFNSAVSKKRSVFQKDMQKRREEFVRQERRERDAFQKEQETARREARGRKMTSEERKNFYGDLDQKRRDFYGGQREKRDAFEADMRDRRKNFDDYVRERTNEFNQEHRAYSRRYDDWKKAQEEARREKEAQSRAKAVDDAEAEFRQLEGKPARPLGTEE